MSPQIENIKNPVIRKLSEDAQHKHTGDFGMTVYGGVNLEKFAELIVKECANTANEWQTNEHPGLLCKNVILDHFGIKE